MSLGLLNSQMLGKKMKVLLGIYFLIPAIVYLWPFDDLLSINTYEYFLPNYLFFSAPVILWCIVTLLVKPVFLIRHAGYIGGVVPLIYLTVLFECCVDNSNSMGWLYLWPYSALSVLVCVSLAYICTRLLIKKS